MGETLKRLGRFTSELLNRIPESRDIINFRNIRVHGYDRVEDEVAGGIVQKQTPVLSNLAMRLLAEF